MKTAKLTLIFVAVILCGYSKQDTPGCDKKQALENFTVCSRMADKWLKTLDSTGYSHLMTLQPINGGNEAEIASYISKLRITYGKVNERKFLGSHIYFCSNQSMLTYISDFGEMNLNHIDAERSEDGFYIVDPKYFGLTSYKQMFSGFPEGDYVILMYKVTPANKSFAEEMLTFLKARLNNPDGSWKLVGYKLADDI